VNEENQAAGRAEGPAPTGLAVIAILSVLFLTYLFWSGLTAWVLEQSGLLTRVYGPDFLDKARNQANPDEAARARFGLWVTCLAFPFQASTIPLVFWLVLREPPARLGLTLRHFRRNLVAGVLGWLILAPGVFGLNFLVTSLYNLITNVGIHEHPLTELAMRGLRPFEWVLLVMGAVVAAPVLEEMLFRGVLQRWFTSHRGGGHLAMTLALVVAIWSRHEVLLRGPWDATYFLELAPVWFVLALLPLYAVVCRLARTPTGPGIFGASLLFAAVHSFAWPTPISLFVLALGLGYLFHWTGSLVGPIVLHALFNGLTCAFLILGWNG
jgi:membrane protease YdiL (CAAX protease family)